MAIQRIDELNLLQSKASGIALKTRLIKYFDVMALSEEEKSRRIEIAIRFHAVSKEMFRQFNELKKSIDSERVAEYLYTFYKSRILDIIDDNELQASQKSIETFARMVVDTTISNNVEFYTSDERAFNNAVDLSNLLYNEEDYQNAVNSGKKTKTWLTMFDDRVRETHAVLEGKTIPIGDMFEVGMYAMRYPLDILSGAGAEEVANCRCVCTYQ